jgi:hypothetical protein
MLVLMILHVRLNAHTLQHIFTLLSKQSLPPLANPDSISLNVTHSPHWTKIRSKCYREAGVNTMRSHVITTLNDGNTISIEDFYLLGYNTM